MQIQKLHGMLRNLERNSTQMSCSIPTSGPVESFSIEMYMNALHGGVITCSSFCSIKHILHKFLWLISCCIICCRVLSGLMESQDRLQLTAPWTIMLHLSLLSMLLLWTRMPQSVHRRHLVREVYSWHGCSINDSPHFLWDNTYSLSIYDQSHLQHS